MIRLSLIVILVTTFIGCMSMNEVGVPLHEQQEALRLIDQGTHLLREGALNEARASFEVSYDIEVSAAAMDGLGCVAFLSGDLKRARDYYLAAYRFDPTYTQSLSNLALLYDYAGAKQASYELYQRVLSKAPGGVPTHNNLGVLLHESGEASAAKEELFRAYVVLPHEILGNNLERVGAKKWQP